MKDLKQNLMNVRQSAFAFLLLPFAFSVVFAQTETPPASGTPNTVTVPAVQETKLPNGLPVAVVERKTVPLVTIHMLIKSAAASVDPKKWCVANLTAYIIT